MIGKVCAADWWVAFHVFVLTTGERTEATLACRWEWINDDGRIVIPASVRKGRRKAMTYRLTPLTLHYLDRLRTNGDELIFARPWKCIETFYLHYTRLLKRAGLPTGRRWKPQMLRRTFGTYAKLAGNDNPLDHESLSTFRKHYNDPTLSPDSGSGQIVSNAFKLA